MYFSGLKGKQFLDLRNDLVITFDNQLITAQKKKSAPDKVSNATYILMGKTSRLRATLRVLKFIWTKQLITIKQREDAPGGYQPVQSTNNKRPPARP